MLILMSTLFVSHPHSSSFSLSTVHQQAGLELGQTGPTWVLAETRDETVGSTGRVLYMICSLLNLLFLLLILLLFQYVQYNNRRGWTGRKQVSGKGRYKGELQV